MKTIMIAFREGGENGGPYNSHLRIMQSSLKDKYYFVPLIVPKGRMGLFNVKIIKSLVQQIKSVRPDAVQIIGLEMIGFYLALACKISGVKSMVLAIHGSTSEAIEFNKNPVKKHIMNCLEIFTLKQATCSYGVSEYVKTIKNVQKYSKNYYCHIYNMILNEEHGNNKENARKEFGILSDQITIVSTGRLIQEKGYDILTEVMLHYADSKKIVFVIAGDGNYKPIMEERLDSQIKSGQVQLLGYRNDIAHILALGDIFVMPSYHETLCMSLIEAGQSGLALIASNVGGMREIIVDGENGYLVEPGNTADFIHKIDLLISNMDELRKIKDNTVISVNKKFANSIAKRKLESLYDSVLYD